MTVSALVLQFRLYVTESLLELLDLTTTTKSSEDFLQKKANMPLPTVLSAIASQP